MQKEVHSKFCHLIYSMDDKQRQYGNLWLGGISTVMKFIMNGNKIGSVVSVLDQQNMVKHQINQKLSDYIVNKLWIDIKDDPKNQIFEYFDQTYKFIIENLKDKNVAVHCRFGSSRSATIVIAFIMRHLKLKMQQAYQYVKSKRQVVKPNEGFLLQLLKYQQKIFNQNNQLNNQSKNQQGNQSKNQQNNLELSEQSISVLGLESRRQNKWMNHIFTLDKSQEIGQAGNLWLGSIGSYKLNLGEQFGITAVLSILDENMMKRYQVNQNIKKHKVSKHKWVILDDDSDEQILPHFNDCYQFIQSNLKAGNVLVHCQGGISRSGSVVIAYIMRKMGISFDDAYAYVRDKRYRVCPNEGFQKQLIKYQQMNKSE